jgi:hypothetical protein
MVEGTQDVQALISPHQGEKRQRAPAANSDFFATVNEMTTHEAQTTTLQPNQQTFPPHEAWGARTPRHAAYKWHCQSFLNQDRPNVAALGF